VVIFIPALIVGPKWQPQEMKISSRLSLIGIQNYGNIWKQRRMAAYSSELAVLTYCLRDLTIPADLWMLKSRQALAM